MKLNQVGDHIESECVGCGEPLLIGSGDSLNFRMGIKDGMPFPEGFLCSLCNKNENKEDQLFVKLQRMCCMECGIDLDVTSPCRFVLDEDGEPKGMVCEDCEEGESWKV
jgi:hypothetical protein